jgi:hypothetical protein
MAEDISTVPVTAENLQVGDVIRWPDGRYYSVDTVPESSHYPAEYSVQTLAIWVTEMDEDMAPAGKRAKAQFPSDGVLDVLTPRPGKERQSR